MPPWYTNPCWSGIILPITPWVTVAWVAVAAFSVEALALLIGPLGIGAPQRRAPRGALAATLLVAACALLAGLIANWMTLSNFVSCPAPFAHYNPALALAARAREAKLIALVRVALVGLAVGLLLSTALAISLYRRWLRHGAAATFPAPSA